MTRRLARFASVGGYGASAVLHVALVACLARAHAVPAPTTQAVALEVIESAAALPAPPVETAPQAPPETPTAHPPPRAPVARRVPRSQPPPSRPAKQPRPELPASEPTAMEEPRRSGPVRLGLSISSTSMSGATSIPVGDTLAGKVLSVAGDPEKTAGVRPGLADEVNEMPALVTGSVPPHEYPAQARRDGFEGSVDLRLLIDDRGAVREASVVADPGHGLGPEAVRIAKRYYRFRPARRAGQPVAVEIPFTVRFKLPG